MSATLQITRHTAFGIELVRRPFDIRVDGTVIGSLEMNSSTELPLEPGPHTLLLRAGRRHSPERSFDVPDGDVVSFSCHGARIWPAWAASFAIPGLGISLHQQ